MKTVLSRSRDSYRCPRHPPTQGGNASLVTKCSCKTKRSADFVCAGAVCYCSESGVTAAAQLRQFHRVFIALRSGRADRDDGSGGGSGSGPFSPRSLLCWPDSALGKLSVRDQTSLTAGERLSRRVTRCSSGHPLVLAGRVAGLWWWRDTRRVRRH